MAVYELINPGDAIYFECDDPQIACFAALVVGRGQCGIRAPTGETLLTPLLFGDAAPDLLRVLGTTDLAGWAKQGDRGVRVSAALAGFTVGRPYVAISADKRAAHNAANRSIAADICASAAFYLAAILGK